MTIFHELQRLSRTVSAGVYVRVYNKGSIIKLVVPLRGWHLAQEYDIMYIAGRYQRKSSIVAVSAVMASQISGFPGSSPTVSKFSRPLNKINKLQIDQEQRCESSLWR